VPTRVALRRPDLIQRRTVSGSRLARRAASGTVNIVAGYYYKSWRYQEEFGYKTRVQMDEHADYVGSRPSPQPSPERGEG
jgi:hypothetical protein